MDFDWLKSRIDQHASIINIRGFMGACKADILGRMASLTSRERQVLSLLPTGMTNRRLAAELGVAERTIRAHLTHIVRKLDVQSRVAAAVLAERHRAFLASADAMPDEAMPQEPISPAVAGLSGS